MTFRVSPHVECRSAYVPELKKEAIAFANTEGGTIDLGVDNEGTPVGLEDPDAVMRQRNSRVRFCNSWKTLVEQSTTATPRERSSTIGCAAICATIRLRLFVKCF